jgi:hypothetical protein
MDNQNSSTGCVVPHGGSSREPERSSDSSTLGSELSSLLESPPKLKQFSLKKSSLRLAGKVSSLQQKTEAGIRTLEYPINAIARKQGVFFCAILSMVAQAGHLYGGRSLMGPVVLTPFGLPPLRLEPHAVVTLTHQRLPV